MPWVMLFVGSAFAGVAVLAVCGVKVFRAVGRLGREIERTRALLEPKTADLARELTEIDRSRE